jgi:hypothetical protein
VHGGFACVGTCANARSRRAPRKTIGEKGGDIHTDLSKKLCRLAKSSHFKFLDPTIKPSHFNFLDFHMRDCAKKSRSRAVLLLGQLRLSFFFKSTKVPVLHLAGAQLNEILMLLRQF